MGAAGRGFALGEGSSCFARLDNPREGGLDAEDCAVRREGLGYPFPEAWWGLFIPLPWESVRHGCCCGGTRRLNNKKYKNPNLATKLN